MTIEIFVFGVKVWEFTAATMAEIQQKLGPIAAKYPVFSWRIK